MPSRGGHFHQVRLYVNAMIALIVSNVLMEIFYRVVGISYDTLCEWYFSIISHFCNKATYSSYDPSCLLMTLVSVYDPDSESTTKFCQ